MTTPKSILQALADGQRFLVCLHVNPDGDTLGAALALGLALRSRGKQVTWACADQPPHPYAFLPGVGEVALPEALDAAAFDTAVAVDVSDHARLGSVAPLFDAVPSRVVIDHHGTNDCFGQMNWVEGAAPAAGLLIFGLLQDMGVALTPALATCLYTALSTDTGHFSFSNTSSETMLAVAALIEAGVDVAAVTQRLYRTRSRAGVQLLARALASLSFDANGAVAGMALTRQDFADVGATEGDAEGIVNYAIEIAGVQAAFLAKENGTGVKISLRARAPHDVALLAQRFGGGGHVLAAGCTLAQPMEQALEQMRDALRGLVAQG